MSHCNQIVLLIVCVCVCACIHVCDPLICSTILLSQHKSVNLPELRQVFYCLL